MKKIIVEIVFVILFTNIAFSQIKGIFDKENIDAIFNSSDDIISNKDFYKKIYLHKADGKLTIMGNATKSPYTVYFVIPIAFREQAPIWFEIDCPQMINYKYIRLSAYNVAVAATLTNTPDTIHLNWTSWVLIKQHDYSDIPASVPIPTISELPDSVTSWLQPTACVQWNDSTVHFIADSVRGSTNDLIVLADKINNYCYNIPWTFPHAPFSFDAYYAMKWGNSCTGHAHAGAAIFRANGIPCRVLLNMPAFYYGNFDMHWMIEYYIPDYGWVKMETSIGSNPYNDAHNEVITIACNIEDEFSITFPDNIESYWFGSDTIFNHLSPSWGGAHSITQYKMGWDTASKIDQIISLTDSVYRYNTIFKGINLNNQQLNYLNIAIEFQNKAFQNAQAVNISNTDSIIYNLNEALFYFRSININPVEEIYFNDFENGSYNWAHGGIKDNWDIGIPSVGPTYCYSGLKCIGSNLDSVYSNYVNSWMESPSIDLTDFSCTYLNFKIWNDVEDDIQLVNPRDRLWVELSLDNGQVFFPISTCFGGVNDDPDIPSFGGWNNVVLDLTEYIDSTVKIRFHFTSNDTISKTGSFIDNVRVYGRKNGWSGIEDKQNLTNTLIGKCFPNPFINKLEIEYYQPSSDDVQIEVFNLTGQIIYNFKLPKQSTGKHKLVLNTSNYLSGIYYVRIYTCYQNMIFKIVRL
ncbi:MAG: T9SS type A sorting domain-containing protein [Bacteroidales bacterium]|nr:T9SS type A sorting domain-containing protein [Bacteroidales bacterium]